MGRVSVNAIIKQLGDAVPVKPFHVVAFGPSFELLDSQIASLLSIYVSEQRMDIEEPILHQSLLRSPDCHQLIAAVLQIADQNLGDDLVFFDPELALS